MKFKNIVNYLLCLLPWFLSAILFKSDTSYYNSLSKPFFAPPSLAFPIIWGILYLLIAYSIFKTIKNSTNNYKIYLTINYLANQLFTFCFFTIKDQFLSLVDTIIVLISSLYLYLETKSQDKNNSWPLVPYIIWNIFALILIFSIYFMN